MEEESVVLLASEVDLEAVAAVDSAVALEAAVEVVLEVALEEVAEVDLEEAVEADLEVDLAVVHLPFRNTSTSTSHPQRQKPYNPQESSLLQPPHRSTIKSSSSRLPLHPPQLLQSSHNSPKTRRRPSSMCWSRGQKTVPKSPSPQQPQLSQASQRYTSSGTGLRRKPKQLVEAAAASVEELEVASVEESEVESAVELVEESEEDLTVDSAVDMEVASEVESVEDMEAALEVVLVEDMEDPQDHLGHPRATEPPEQVGHTKIDCTVTYCISTLVLYLYIIEQSKKTRWQ